MKHEPDLEIFPPERAELTGQCFQSFGDWLEKAFDQWPEKVVEYTVQWHLNNIFREDRHE